MLPIDLRVHVVAWWEALHEISVTREVHERFVLVPSVKTHQPTRE